MGKQSWDATVTHVTVPPCRVYFVGLSFFYLKKEQKRWSEIQGRGFRELEQRDG